MSRPQVPTDPHPLEPFAADAIRRREAVTVAELAEMLGGRSAAYRKVAGDVLDRMEARGVVWWNDAGQYRLSDPFDQAGPALPELTQVAACGMRPGTMPPGFEDMTGSQYCPLPDQLDRLEAWARDHYRKGASMILIKGVAIDKDGRPL